MKLIIDIPDEDYERLKDGHIPFSILDVMQDGIPLDKIRTKIENINLNEVATKYEDRFYGFQQEVIKIIDKYRNEVNE